MKISFYQKLLLFLIWNILKLNASVTDLLKKNNLIHSQKSILVTQSFIYTGAAQNYLVPTGVTSLTVTLTGGSGGAQSTFQGGFGAIMTCVIPVNPGDTLQIYVGGRGSLSTGNNGNGNLN